MLWAGSRARAQSWRVSWGMGQDLAPALPSVSLLLLSLFDGDGTSADLVVFCFLGFLNLFLAALGLRCCVWAFSSCSERGLPFVAVRGLLIAVASLVAEHGL